MRVDVLRVDEVAEKNNNNSNSKVSWRAAGQQPKERTLVQDR